MQIEFNTGEVYQVERRDSLADVKTIRFFGAFIIEKLEILHSPIEIEQPDGKLDKFRVLKRLQMLFE